MYMTAWQYKVGRTPVCVEASGGIWGDFKIWKQWESMPCGRIEVWPMRGTTRRVTEMVLNVLFPWSVFQGQSVILKTTFKNLRGEVKNTVAC